MNKVTRPTPGEQPTSLALRAIANKCNSGSCPTIYLTGTGSVVVQGYTVPAERADVTVADGETLVEIPLELLTEALKNLD